MSYHECSMENCYWQAAFGQGEDLELSKAGAQGLDICMGWNVCGIAHKGCLCYIFPVLSSMVYRPSVFCWRLQHLRRLLEDVSIPPGLGHG